MCTPQACALPIIARSAQELAAKIQKKLELAIKAALCNCCNTNIVSLLRRLPITSTRENAHEVCSCITLREDRPQNPVSTSSAALRNACVIMRTKATKQFRTTFVQRPADLGSSGHERLDNELAIACVVVPVFCCQQLGGGKVSNFGLIVVENNCSIESHFDEILQTKKIRLWGQGTKLTKPNRHDCRPS